MRKSMLFVSAALTTLILATVFGVASAYQKIVRTPAAVVAQIQPTEVVVPTAANTATSVPTLATISVEQAAALASDVLGRTDLYSGEIAQWNGVDTYLITFSSGDEIYVSMTGQILFITKIVPGVVLAPTYNNYQSSNNGGSGAGGNTGGGTSSGGYNDGEHEGGDD